MKSSIKIKVFSLLACVMLVSCNQEESLQTYFVDNQETSGFISVDIPTSIVELDKATMTNDQKEAYKSVKKLNFLGFKRTENNQNVYNEELSKVKAILKNEKYIELLEFNDKAANVVVKYIGNNNDVIDELIVFTSSKDMGFGIVRVLGNNMRPEKMVGLVDAIKKTDFKTSQFEDVMGFFK